MTDTLSLSASETRILSKLIDAKEPVSKADLMEGVTDKESSFKVIMSRLRLKGFSLDPGKRGLAAPAAYSLNDEEKARLRQIGL